MSNGNCAEVNCVAAPLPLLDQDIQASLSSKNPDTPKSTKMSRPACPTTSFETRQYRVARGSAGEDKVEVVRERIYVGGLNSEVTGELLAEVFSQYGQVGFLH